MCYLTIFPFISMILTVYTSTHCFVYIQLSHNQSRSMPKMSLKVSLHGLFVTGNHRCIEYMVVTVKVTKICVKKEFKLIDPVAVPSTITSKLTTVY